MILRRLCALLASFCSLLCAAGELSNRPAPDFHLSDSQGRMVSLSSFKGKVLLVEFLSTTCPHCQKFAPVLDSVYTRLKGRVAVVGISTFPDTAETVAEFVKTYKISYPVLVDPTNKAAIDYLKPDPNHGFSIPHVFVVDQSGYIRDDFVQNPSNAELFTPEGLTRLLRAYLTSK
ncbi:MAG TPA: TlpA disulfide reductase family protein [Bryobacterales bacterium]|jgi:peroxiredoxin|nr:TlpA disulfide reductase family protein [Bryobacterales bacterium]